MWSGFSWALGALDNAYTLTHLRPQRPRFFADGWGDLEAAEAAQSELFQRTPGAPPSLRWAEARGNVCGATFRSPQAGRLPEEAQDAHFLFVSPQEEGKAKIRPWEATRDPSDVERPSAIVVLLPATGEETADARAALAQELAKTSMCSLILTAPLYGDRKPKNQQMHYIRSVGMYLEQSTAIVEEAALAVRWCVHAWPGVPICVSGYSWGGAMTCLTAILASRWEPSAQVLAVPYAGSATPAVLVDGLLQDDIQWSSLADGEPFQETRDRLLQVLLKTHLSKIIESVEGQEDAGTQGKIAGLHAVSFENDAFVKPEYGEELFALTSRCCKPSARRELAWQPGGHVYAFLARRRVQVPAIQQACAGLAASRL
ncbi:Abhd18 [Symbiodinium natans]|uniref:Abhd18 protein n=1 Tax=Symbiodinium natans TaxID=878477 RepID=A0A812TFB6_9DINO|nr:Abhd18 [Symbiodinium natans]